MRDYKQPRRKRRSHILTPMGWACMIVITLCLFIGIAAARCLHQHAKKSLPASCHNSNGSIRHQARMVEKDLE